MPVKGSLGFGPGGGELAIEANWEDGYFLSGGLEYDYSDKLTIRGGVAYEWSPIQEAEQRLAYVPDSDRVWLSAGATYKWNEQTSIDLAYTHIFVEDSDINRVTTTYQGDVESSVDIIGVSVKTKWGKDGPLVCSPALTTKPAPHTNDNSRPARHSPGRLFVFGIIGFN